MILTPVNSWKKLNFDVQVLDENVPMEELVIYSAYACKLYYAYVSGGQTLHILSFRANLLTLFCILTHLINHTYKHLIM